MFVALVKLVLLTFSWFAVPAELEADGGEEVPDKLLDVLVEVGVGKQRRQNSQVAAEVAPHCVVWLVDECFHQLQHLDCADHPCTRLEAHKQNKQHLSMHISDRMKNSLWKRCRAESSHQGEEVVLEAESVHGLQAEVSDARQQTLQHD